MKTTKVQRDHLCNVMKAGVHTGQLQSGFLFDLLDDIDTLESRIRTLEAALEWIAKGPTWGPGAPGSAEQVVMSAKRAREALEAKAEEG